MTPEQSSYIRKLVERVQVLEASVSIQGQQILALHEQLKKKTAPRFSPPTLEEVTQLVRHKGYLVDPETFYHYYEAQGWKLSNGRPMVKWQSALVTFSKHTEFLPAQAVQQQRADSMAAARKRDREKLQRQHEEALRQHQQDFGLRIKKP